MVDGTLRGIRHEIVRAIAAINGQTARTADETLRGQRGLSTERQLANFETVKAAVAEFDLDASVGEVEAERDRRIAEANRFADEKIAKIKSAFEDLDLDDQFNRAASVINRRASEAATNRVPVSDFEPVEDDEEDDDLDD